MKKHNGVISIWKFIFALLILLHHLYAITDGKIKHDLFICGAIGVDFFFIVSGVLLALKVESEQKKHDTRSLPEATWKFIWGKLKGVYPYLIFSLLLMATIKIHFRSFGVKYFIRGILDLSMLQMLGLPRDGLLGGCWYLSAMILSMMIIYPLQKKLGKNYSGLIGPIVAMLIGGYLYYNFPSMRKVKTYTGLCYLGLAKGFYQITLGCTAYEISKLIRKVAFTKFGRCCLSVLEVFLLGGVFYLNARYNNVREYDWIFVIMLLIGISIAFSEKTMLIEFSKNKVFYYLEKLSVPMYLNNFIFIQLLNNSYKLKRLPWSTKCVVEVVGVILLSMLELVVIDYVKKIKWSKISRLFWAEYE